MDEVTVKETFRKIPDKVDPRKLVLKGDKSDFFVNIIEQNYDGKKSLNLI